MAIEKKANISIVAALVEKGAKVMYRRQQSVKEATFEPDEEVVPNTVNCLLLAADKGNRCRNCACISKNIITFCT